MEYVWNLTFSICYFFIFYLDISEYNFQVDDKDYERVGLTLTNSFRRLFKMAIMSVNVEVKNPI